MFSSCFVDWGREILRCHHQSAHFLIPDVWVCVCVCASQALLWHHCCRPSDKHWTGKLSSATNSRSKEEKERDKEEWPMWWEGLRDKVNWCWGGVVVPSLSADESCHCHTPIKPSWGHFKKYFHLNHIQIRILFLASEFHKQHMHTVEFTSRSLDVSSFVRHSMPLQIRSNCCSGVQLSSRMLYLFNNIIQLQQNSTVMYNYRNIKMAYENSKQIKIFHCIWDKYFRGHF